MYPQEHHRVVISLSITLAFVIVEAFAGWYANSLALISDAVHNLTDVIALGLSGFAIWLSMRPADGKRTFGFHRAGILIALLNSATLVVFSISIFYESIRRLHSPQEVDTQIMIWTGIIALFVNALTAWLIRKGSENDLNIRSAFIHLMGDVFSTAGAILAGVIIYFTGWNFLDPLVSFLIGGLILWNAWGILRETINILLESTPNDINIEKLVNDITSLEGVHGIHDLHIWSINQSMRNFSAHILISDYEPPQSLEIQNSIKELLRTRYNITHITLQLETICCESSNLFCSGKI
jgi:cobalt-zinc-cadmium efflux system protein